MATKIVFSKVTSAARCLYLFLLIAAWKREIRSNNGK